MQFKVPLEISLELKKVVLQELTELGKLVGGQFVDREHELYSEFCHVGVDFSRYFTGEYSLEYIQSAGNVLSFKVSIYTRFPSGHFYFLTYFIFAINYGYIYIHFQASEEYVVI